MMKDEHCIFCKIAAGEIPSRTLYENEQFRVIMDLNPATRGHALILPKNHFANLYELPDETAAEAMKLAKRMAEHMTKQLNCDGFNLLQNNGEYAGQTVLHFHMHLIPRYKDDKQTLGLKGRGASEEELDQVKKMIAGSENE